MGHTNSTTNLNLPQFIGTDKPTFLGDINGAFAAIDTAYGTQQSAIESAASAASAATTAANAATTAAGNAATAAAEAGTAASGAVTTANNAASTANNAQSTATAAQTAAEGAATAAASATAGVTALDARVDAIEPEVVASVTADGVKTYSEILVELYAAAIAENISSLDNLVLQDGAPSYSLYVFGDSALWFSSCFITGVTSASIIFYSLDATNGSKIQATITTAGTTFTDHSTDVPASGRVIRLVRK